MADRTDRADRAGRGRRRVPRWLVPSTTFVAGIVVGVLTVGLLTSGTPDFAATTAGSTPAPSGRSSLEVSAQARVNAACLRVINDAQDAYTALQGVGQAATDVDLQTLDDIVRQLQPVEARLDDDLPACQIDTSVDQPGSSTSAAPSGSASPSPSASPTR